LGTGLGVGLLWPLLAAAQSNWLWDRLAAARNGDVPAAAELCTFYVEEGARDFIDDVRTWCGQAERGGDLEAAYTLGRLYYDADGIAVDYAEAVRHLRLAADGGHSMAQLVLGVMYKQGRGVPQDLPQAIDLYRRSALQGNGVALRNLGNNFRAGTGVRKDPLVAYAFYVLAERSGGEARTDMDEMRGQREIDADGVLAAQQLALSPERTFARAFAPTEATVHAGDARPAPAPPRADASEEAAERGD